ncbi:hypothetical protein [Mucilaginibacter sp.]|nr:hypothetical protein [Mucilaginibacter sp.]HTI60366.1 hypothetical protein [Mucilaginibacter sp.]
MTHRVYLFVANGKLNDYCLVRGYPSPSFKAWKERLVTYLADG